MPVTHTFIGGIVNELRAVAILHPWGKLSHTKVDKKVSTTTWVKAALVATENEVELIEVGDNTYLAYNALAFDRHIPLNAKATAMLRNRYNCPLKVYGDAVILKAV
jgi:hypothetical protein